MKHANVIQSVPIISHVRFIRVNVSVNQALQDNIVIDVYRIIMDFQHPDALVNRVDPLLSEIID